MAPKTKRHHGDDDTVEVESSSVELKTAPKRHHGDADTVEAAEFSKPVYLVARVSADDKSSSATSVFVVDAAAAATTGVNNNPRKRARHLGELPLPASTHGMSFVAAHSKHGSWIVATGGPKGTTIIYDPRTLEAFRGQGLNSPKHEPILISHGGKVYAISRTPSVRPGRRRRRDFVPWFESLSFNKGVPCILHDDCTEWKSLPPPPFIPWLMDPLEYRHPPKITILSYAAVGSHILFSPRQEQEDVAMGTYAFHVVEKTWEKVWNENLPFLGQAVHLGGTLFAAACSNNLVATASVFRMSIEVSAVSPAVSSNKLSVMLVQQFPVASSEWKVPRPLFCPLGKGGFCVIRKVSFRRKKECLKMSFTSFQMEPMLTACQTENADSGDMHVAVKVEHHDCRCKFMVQSQDVPSPLTVVAALSMKQ